MRNLFRACLTAVGSFYDVLIPPRIEDRSRAHLESRGDGPEAVSAGLATTAPASGRPNAVTTLGVEHRDRLWLLSGDIAPAHVGAMFYGWYRDRWCWTTDGDRWRPAAAQRGDQLPGPSGEHWIEVVGWPFETSGAFPPAAEDDPGASSPLAPGSPHVPHLVTGNTPTSVRSANPVQSGAEVGSGWGNIPRGYHDDESDEFHWVRWVIPAIDSALRNHFPNRLAFDGPILCARADGTPCAELADIEAWVSHVSPNVASRIHAAAAAQS